MYLMIAEKAIAGKLIAEILSGKKVVEKRDGGASYFEFQYHGAPCIMLPLSGHISEVDFPKQFNQWQKTPLKELTFAPLEYHPSQPSIVALLQRVAPNAEKVTIATDADREGESIGVEAIRYLKEKNPKLKFDRAYFSAIAPKDIQKAWGSLTHVDYHFADSADSRREIDLIWGAVLTRYISLASARYGKNFLSVGRVQTPVLRLIVDREKERLAFLEQPYWEIQATFEKQKTQFVGFHKKGKFWKKEEALAAMEKKSDTGTVTRVEKSKRTIAKPVPFNTTEFQRAATSIGFNIGEAMNIAENLYQQGYTSYPRTDNSVYPASLDLREVLRELQKVPSFVPLVEKILSLPRIEPSRGKESQDHPPIYPVTAAPRNKLSDRQWKIYELIVRRFLATLSESAETENLVVEIDVRGEPYLVHGQLILKLGWKELYPYSAISEVRLPPLEKGDEVSVKKIELLEKKTTPPARYSQGALIKLMEELGLGTKSTRHAIIQKLYDRQYVFGNKAIEPNKVSFAVIDVLKQYGHTITEPSLTVGIEKKMEEIAAGTQEKDLVVKESRDILAEIVDVLEKNKEAVSAEIRTALKDEMVYGPCPTCGKPLAQRKGYSGKRFVGCTGYPDCHTAFPLPQKGMVRPHDKACASCGKPMVFVQVVRRRPYTMCLDPQCVSKKDWKKKTTAPAATPALNPIPKTLKETKPQKKIVKKKGKGKGN